MNGFMDRVEQAKGREKGKEGGNDDVEHSAAGEALCGEGVGDQEEERAWPHGVHCSPTIQSCLSFIDHRLGTHCLLCKEITSQPQHHMMHDNDCWRMFERESAEQGQHK